jgi:hypothetical protein
MSATTGFGVIIIVRSEPLLVVPSVIIHKGCRTLVRSLALETRELGGCRRAWIAHTAETLKQSCFEDLASLSGIIFEPGSWLQSISEQAFANWLSKCWSSRNAQQLSVSTAFYGAVDSKRLALARISLAAN